MSEPLLSIMNMIEVECLITFDNAPCLSSVMRFWGYFSINTLYIVPNLVHLNTGTVQSSAVYKVEAHKSCF